MRILAIGCLFAGILGANTCTLTGGTYASIAATSTHWTGSGCTGAYVPVSGDSATLAGSALVHVATSETFTVGSNSGNVGIGLHVGGTSTFTVDAGGTLLTKGNDHTTNAAATIDSGSALTVAGAWQTDNSGDYTSSAQNSGTVSLTSGAVATVPAANYSWNVTGSPTSVGAGWKFAATQAGTKLYAFSVPGINVTTFHPISNSGGTGVASFGNTSLSFGSVVPTGALTTEVASMSALTTAGQYYMDYASGLGYSVTLLTSATATYKMFTASYAKGWGIINKNGASFSCNGASLNYMGNSSFGFPLGGTIDFQGQNAAQAVITNCSFNWGYKAIAVTTNNLVGSSGAHVVWSGNTFQELSDVNGFGAIYFNSTTASYLDIINPVVKLALPFISFANGTGTYITSDHVNVSGATGTLAYFWASDYSMPCADCSIHDICPITNGLQTCYGYGYGVNLNLVSTVYGTSGHPFLVYKNSPYGVLRGFVVGSYTETYNNMLQYSTHHDFVMGDHFVLDTFITNVHLYNNICVIGALDSDGGCINVGYSRPIWLDRSSAYHNTSVGGTVSGVFSLGDPENLACDLLMQVDVRDNLMYSRTSGSSQGSGRYPPNSGVGYATRTGMTLLGYNFFYNAVTPWLNYNGGSIFKQGSTPYNTSLTRNVTGVQLFNPSYSTAQSGSALKFTFTSATNMTLQWSLGGVSYGTAQQLVFGGPYVITGATAIRTPQVAYAVTVVGTPWSTTVTSASNPTTMWFVGLTGNVAGKICAITTTVSSNVINVPCSDMSLAAASFTGTFQIINSELIVPATGVNALTDEAGTNTVDVGIDPRLLPTSSQTDTGISITLTDGTTIDPAFSNGDNLDGQYAAGYAPTAPALATAASDGTTPGAIPAIVAATAIVIQ